MYRYVPISELLIENMQAIAARSGNGKTLSRRFQGMENTGVEPVASAVRSQRSTN